MSEYQFYDFRAVDRPLTSSQRMELGKISTRADISPTRFTNFYTFGDFKGNPVVLVERYFDAFLYLANWGTRELMFRVPLGRAPSARVLRSYLSTRVQAAAWFRVRGPHVVVGFRSDREGEDWDSHEEGELASIVPVRSDLLMGGVRVFYLGWLLRVQEGEVAENATEPDLPAELERLSGGEAALVDFLRIDHHLIAAAVQRRRGRPAKARTAGELLSIANTRREEVEQRAAQKAQRDRERGRPQTRSFEPGISSHSPRAKPTPGGRWRVWSRVESRQPTTKPWFSCKTCVRSATPQGVCRSSRASSMICGNGTAQKCRS